jgi:hypothetical protein
LRPAHCVAEWPCAAAGEHHLHREVVLQIAADRQVDHGHDAGVTQMRRRSNAGQHQKLRRVEGTGREDHLARGARGDEALGLAIGDADRARAAQQQFCGQGLRRDRQVGAMTRRLEVGVRRRGAAAVTDRILTASETFVLRRIVVLGDRVAGCLGRIHPGGEQRVPGTGPLHADGAAAAAIRRLAVLPGLEFLEVRQDLRIGPALRAATRPTVIIATVAAREGHDIDRGGAAQHFAAHRFDPPVVQLRLRFAVITPIEHAALVHAAQAQRHMDIRVIIAGPGFQQQDAGAAVFAQPVREDAAGRAAADNHVVIFACRLSPRHAPSMTISRAKRHLQRAAGAEAR